MDNRKLLKPIKIGSMIIKNRMAFPPMNTNYTNENGAPTELMMDYYARRAKGGAGLITVESTTIDPKSRNHAAQPQIASEAVIPAWSRLTDKVHRFDAKVSIELNHFGADGTVSCGDSEVSSSNVTSRGPQFDVKSLSIEKIHKLQDDYVNAVLNAKEAGFDAITFHAAHGNIMPQFFSTMFNKRTDWYGGSLVNRMRFTVEIVEKARKAVGKNFPLIMRISGEEYLEGGRSLEETVEICKLMENAGIDAFDISGGIQATYLFSISPYNFPGIEGFMMPAAKAIKEATTVPIIAAGGVRDSEFAEKLLQNGFADIISFGRAFLADPDFGVKTIMHRGSEIRPCLSCQNCLSRIDKDRFLTCTVNPEVGRENDFKKLEATSDVKNVLVVGGGAAGLEAARVARLCHHNVTLIEKRSELGGSMYVAGIPPHKEKIIDLVKWYERTLIKDGVKIIKNKEYVPEFSKKMDITFIATGAKYLKNIPGSEDANVLTAAEALIEPEKVGEKIAIIGGGATGCEVAEFFGAQEIKFKIKCMKDFAGELVCETYPDPGFKNKDVTIIEMTSEIGVDIESFSKKILLKTLELNKVKLMTNSKVWNIEGNIIRVIDMAGGEIIELQADTVILAGGLISNRVELGEIESKIVYLGDANRPGRIVDAVFQAYCAAKEISN